MKLFYDGGNYKLYNGNMLQVSDVVEENSIDCIITDPPYELNFMGKDWDNSGIVYQKETWKKLFDVLKPGGFLLVFGFPRTFHRVFCAIEDAGFEIRDVISWIYGSGMPKGLNIANAIEGKILLGSSNKKDQKKLDGEKGVLQMGYVKSNALGGFRPNDYSGTETTVKPTITTEEAKKWIGWNSAIKPAYEPIMVARKPFAGSLVDNILTNGVGAYNVDECRVGFISDADEKESKDKNRHADFGSKHSQNVYNDWSMVDMKNYDPVGRFPSNVILSYGEDDKDLVNAFPQSKSTGGSGEKSIKSGLSGNVYQGGWSHDKAGEHLGGLGDSGSTARFFMNCEFEEDDFFPFVYNPKASKSDRNDGVKEGRNVHPTVKPTSLLRYLIKLVCPKNATVLDPFNGSGSMGKALMLENNERMMNYNYIGIDLSDEYLQISKDRIEYAKNPLMKQEEVREVKQVSTKQNSLW